VEPRNNKVWLQSQHGGNGGKASPGGKKKPTLLLESFKDSEKNKKKSVFLMSQIKVTIV